jgi:hypothetical protein
MENFENLVVGFLPLAKGPTGNTIMFGPLDEKILSSLLKELVKRDIRIDVTGNRYSFIFADNYFTIW